LQRYSFLYKGYEDEWYFWFILVAARKVMLAMVGVFLANQPQTQALLTIFVVVMALCFHVMARPFKNDVMDWYSRVLSLFIMGWSSRVLSLFIMGWSSRVLFTKNDIMGWYSRLLLFTAV
jgi:hypothetical protein